MSESKNILTLITRDGRLQVSHILAKQISPLLKNFIDNWNQDDTIYLNYTSEEVNNVLNIFNPPDTLKDFLMIETKKELLFVDVIDDILKYIDDMKVKILPNLDMKSANINGRTEATKNPLEVIITLNNINCLYLFNEQASGKYILYKYDQSYKIIADVCTLDLINKIKSKQPGDIKNIFKSVFYYIPKTLLDFYPLNERNG